MMEVGWGKREVGSEKMEEERALDAGGGRRMPASQATPSFWPLRAPLLILSTLTHTIYIKSN